MAAGSNGVHLNSSQILGELFSTEESEDSGSDFDDELESSDSEEYVSDDSSDDEPLSAKVPRLVVDTPTSRPRQRGGKSAAAKASRERWKDGAFHPKVFPFLISSADQGVNGNIGITEDFTELQFFKLIFDRDILEHVVAETNKFYIFLVASGTVKANSKLHLWKDTNVDEMYRFLGIVMLMSLQKKQKMTQYWSTDPLIATPIFGKLMSCNRFHLILRALHFNDNNLQMPGDKLYKIRPIIEMLKFRFGVVFYPHQNVVIDESLMLWKGRLSFKQYIPSKRHRFGIKLFILCDCKTGYVVDLIVYTGATTEIIRTEGDMGISGAIVMTLMEKFLRKGHTLFTDNWYTSPALAEKLHSEETGTCGTVKPKRKGMPVFVDKLKKGDLTEKHTDKMLAVKWHDRRDVHLLSTVSKTGQSKTGKRDRITDEDIVKPTCVIEYNKNMGAIDKSDMQLSFVECVRKTAKWYKKFFFHLLDMSVYNAYILYKESTGIRKLEFSEFRLELIRQIIQESHHQRKNPKGGRNSKSENPLRLTERHFIVQVPNTGQKSKVGKRCHVCANTNQGEKKRRESRYMCKECDVGLCVTPCFEIFHTKLHFLILIVNLLYIVYIYSP